MNLGCPSGCQNLQWLLRFYNGFLHNRTSVVEPALNFLTHWDLQITNLAGWGASRAHEEFPMSLRSVGPQNASVETPEKAGT